MCFDYEIIFLGKPGDFDWLLGYPGAGRDFFGGTKMFLVTGSAEMKTEVQDPPEREIHSSGSGYPTTACSGQASAGCLRALYRAKSGRCGMAGEEGGLWGKIPVPVGDIQLTTLIG
jgi:hypothetical protein